MNEPHLRRRKLLVRGAAGTEVVGGDAPAARLLHEIALDQAAEAASLRGWA